MIIAMIIIMIADWIVSDILIGEVLFPERENAMRKQDQPR